VSRWARWREPFEPPPGIPVLPPEWARVFDPLAPPGPKWWAFHPFSGRWWGETLGPCGRDFGRFLLQFIKLLLALGCWGLLLLLAAQVPLWTYRWIGRRTGYRNPFLDALWEGQGRALQRIRRRPPDPGTPPDSAGPP